MQSYASKGYFAKDGVPFLRSTQIKLAQDTNVSDLDAILEDADGVAFGNVKYTLDVENPIPEDGFEVNWFVVCEAKEISQVEVVILKPEGGVLWTKLLKGIFFDPSGDIMANKPISASVKYRGRPYRAAP
jgi:hypothetical protein